MKERELIRARCVVVMAIASAGMPIACNSPQRADKQEDRAAAPPQSSSPARAAIFPPGDSGAMGGVGPGKRTPGGPGAPCPADGRWAPCSLEKRLSRSGFVLRPADGAVAKRDGFSVTPVGYLVGKDSRAELFFYRDEKTLARDVAALDTITAAPRGKPGSWGTPPWLVRSSNMIAVLLTRDSRLAERFSLAVTAGPPQKR